MTYLAVPISAKNPAQAKEQINKAVTSGAELLELRMDYLENLSVGLLRALIEEVRRSGPAVPIIVTCRDKREGGTIDYPSKLRLEVLVGALEAGADFIDLEYQNFILQGNRTLIEKALSRNAKGRLILSVHDFEKRFDDIKGLYRQIRSAFPSAIPKLVYTANHINDCFDAFDLLHETNGERIVFCMGQAGLISRILAKKLGSFLTFASLDEQSATAPGQSTIDQFRKLYRFDSTNTDTQLYGVIADPVGHSLSPAIHNACFADQGMNRLYLPLLVQGGREGFDLFLDDVLSRPWLDFHGFSVTIPHKENALNYVKAYNGHVEPLAEKIGAVNTMVLDEGRETKDEGRIAAYNTDYAGALDAIVSGTNISRANLKSLPVAILGAGGVARAIVAGLSDAGAKIRIYNRTVSRAQELASEFGCEFAGLDALDDMDAKLLINCTSIGMHPNINQTPVPKEYLKPGMAVFDTVYNPAETLLLKQAKDIGAKTIDGLSMFINQAAEQFKLFTGQNADRGLMRRTIKNFL
jgi:3-dehydroquinate dehydratase/shikimate dehydrogenase